MSGGLGEGCGGCYLIVVRYGSEAERKRLEYLLDKWRGSLRVSRPSGAVLFVDAGAEQVSAFLEELYSRIPRERIVVYRLEEAGLRLEPFVLEGAVRVGVGVEEAWGIVGLVFARLRGVLLSEVAGERVYSVSGKGGVCRVKVSVVPSGSGSLLRFVVEGYGEVVARVYDRLLRELSYVGEVVERDRGL